MASCRGVGRGEVVRMEFSGDGVVVPRTVSIMCRRAEARICELFCTFYIL